MAEQRVWRFNATANTWTTIKTIRLPYNEEAGIGVAGFIRYISAASNVRLWASYWAGGRVDLFDGEVLCRLLVL